MRYYKDNKTTINYRVIGSSLKPVLNILMYFGLAIVFLFISAYMILGKPGASESGENKSIGDNGVKNYDNNVNDIVNKDGSKENTEFNLKAGNVKVYLTKEGRIVDLPLEEYIKGVISSEMPVTFEIEALKAQAIAARTYTIAHTKALGGGCANAKGADLCDTIHCQVYMNKATRLNAWGIDGDKNWQKIEQAVNGTAGMVLTYNNELAKGAYYFSTSSGKTENVEEVFVNALPYLRSVESPGEEIAPKYKSAVTIPFSKFASTVNSAYKDAGVDVNKIKDQVQIKSRTEGGSVKEIKLANVTIPGTKFRTLFGLNSANFQLEFLSKEVVVKCTGNGHGVGMSQWGANVMAKEGEKYNDILTHYYSGVEIKSVKK
ncbi:stage II sporulation protein D [Clostridium sp.]|uniref:stage II sporulation protein D n=1 Tax=Clostridium sp. TaxID=1506 RepID=UPI002FC92781